MLHTQFRPMPRRPRHVGRATALRAMFALPALIAVPACSSRPLSTPADTASSAVAAAASTTGAAATTARTAAVTNSVPLAVAAVGTYGENAYDMAKANNWAAARAAADSLKTGAAGLAALPQSAGQAGAVTTTLTALDQAITQHQHATAMREANHLTQLGAELTRPYHPTVPPEVALLDYYGRELEVWSVANNPAKLQSTAASMRQTWDTLKPQLATHNAAAVSAHFDSLVTQVSSAKSTADYARLATPLLDAVDNLEKAFAR